MASAFGWDLLYKTVEQDIKNKQDVLVCLSHFVLISNGFKCIGLGESKVLDGSETKTEVLPKGWNREYALRYVYQGRLYNYKVTNLDDAVMINLLRVDERTVSLVQLNTSAVVQQTGTLEKMIPDSENIINLIKKQLVDKVTVSKKSKDTAVQTDRDTIQPQQPVRDSSQPTFRVPAPSIAQPDIFRDVNNIGYNDLYPLGVGRFDPVARPGGSILPGGGGMLFDPPRPFGGGFPPGVAPGSVPPGARFDPFRSPDERIPPRRPPNRPDNDEMPPPGYDDMFL